MSDAFTSLDERRAAPGPRAAPPGAASSSSSASSAGVEGGTEGSEEKVLALSPSHSFSTGTNASSGDREGDPVAERKPSAAAAAPPPPRAKGGDRLALTDAAERDLLSRLLERSGPGGVASYWSQRAKTFGSGPVTLTHEESDLVLTKQEQFWVLPSAARTDRGGVVFFVDGTVPFPDASDESRLRCLFFLAAANGALLANGEGNATDDDAAVVLLVALPPQGADEAMIDQVGSNLEAFLTFLFLMPVELEAMHFVVAAGNDGVGDDDNDDGYHHLEIFRQNLGLRVRDKSHFHSVSSTFDAAAALESHGLRRPALPTRLGGTLQRQESSEWLLQHSRADNVEAGNAAPFSGKVQDPSLGADEDSLRSDRSEIVPIAAAAGAAAVAGASSSPARTNASTNRNSQEFIRKRNAVYARRKYARRKIEVQVLNEQKDELEEQRTRLQAEGRRLEGLLRKARRDVIHLHSANSLATASGLPSIDTLRGSRLSPPSESGQVDSMRNRPARSSLAAEQLQDQEQPPRVTDWAAASWPNSGSALSRYLESLREGRGSHSSRHPVPEPPPASSSSMPMPTSGTEAEEEVAARRRDVTLRLAMLHRQHQQWQLQQQLGALRAATASAADHHQQHQQQLPQPQHIQQLQLQLQLDGNHRPGPSLRRHDPSERRQEEREGRSPVHPRGR